ncbi:outer membrane beta-barrel family protein [Sediminicola luteus]|uniref:Outer membrane protein beta-barrel domain-containing protein n=1 Tax=Sediminicola luteus TaxID=319238 RepID=A0A2A4GE92_9FLAO|nr:outer membrane beta-barrel family protein [Sediminicola luteus]PCE66731.1 hypothetical protein B7P33_05420 [Sediminicola luteus]
MPTAKFAQLVLPLICFVLGANLLLAQDITLTGKVSDSEGNPVGLASVFIMKTADSTLVSGVSADDDGQYKLTHITAGTYLIQASYISKLSEYRRIEVEKDTGLRPLIIEGSVEELEEVVVAAGKPRIKRLADRLVFDVKNSVVSNNNSWDILKKTPGVLSIGDRIMVRNQAPTLFLNGRKLQLTPDEVQDLLQGLDGQNISSIEIIHAPSAKYDASDAPILNIVTDKAVSTGYKGNLSGRYTQAVFSKFGFSTGHYYKTDKVNLFANYSINPAKKLKKDWGYAHFEDENGVNFTNWDSDFERVTKSLSQNIGTILDIETSEKGSLNFTGNLAFSPSTIDKTRTLVDMTNGVGTLDSLQSTQSRLDTHTSNLGLDLTYVHQMSDMGAELRFNTHLTLFDDHRDQGVSSDYLNAGGDLINEVDFATQAEKDIQIFTAQVDYSTPWGESRFETGLKTSHIDSESGIDYFNLMGGTSTLIPGLSDLYNYKERTHAGYVNLAHEWEKWSFSGGLRLEYIDASGESNQVTEINEQEYLELFPTFQLGHKPNANHSFVFDYSRRIERPRYQDLNPFAYFINENQFSLGNPNLRPSFTHNFNFNYTLKDTYSFDLYYRDNGHEIAGLAFQDNERVRIVTEQQNILGSRSYGLDVTWAQSFTDFWYSYLYGSIFWEEQDFLATQSGNMAYTNDIQAYYIAWSNFLTLSKDSSWRGEVSLVYLSNYLTGTYIIEAGTNLTLGVVKSFWNDRATLSITGEDVLNTYNAWARADFLNQDHGYKARIEQQLIRVGFTYKFGNFRLNDNRRELEKEELDRLE